MGSATGLTAAEMENIRNGTIAGAQIDGNGYLILTRRDGATINAGLAKGSATAETANPTPSTLARRDPSGRTKFADPVDAQDAATKSFVDQLVKAAMPPGSIIEFGGPSAPPGWLLCDGSAVSRTTYADLFAAIGTANGTGDGVATFNVPDKRGRVSVGLDPSDSDFNASGKQGGEKAVRLTETQIPSHTHLQEPHTHTQNSHTHTQNSHSHSMSSHNHTQNAHDHSMSAHNHTPYYEKWYAEYGDTTSNETVGEISGTGWLMTQTTGAIRHATITASTTSNPHAQTAVNNSSSISPGSTTATNQSTTATNQSTTATNRPAGGDGRHNNLQPYDVQHYIIKV